MSAWHGEGKVVFGSIHVEFEIPWTSPGRGIQQQAGYMESELRSPAVRKQSPLHSTDRFFLSLSEDRSAERGCCRAMF